MKRFLLAICVLVIMVSACWTAPAPTPTRQIVVQTQAPLPTYTPPPTYTPLPPLPTYTPYPTFTQPPQPTNTPLSPSPTPTLVPPTLTPIPMPTSAPTPTVPPSPTRAPTATLLPPTPTPLPAVSALQFRDIANARETSTDAQWKLRLPTYIGVRVAWKGTVSSVSSSGTVLLNPPGESGLSMWSIDLGKLPQVTYLALNKGQVISFEATIKSYADIFGFKYLTMTETVLR